MLQKSARALEERYSYLLCGSSRHNKHIGELAEQIAAQGPRWPVGTPPLDVPGQDSMELSKLHWDKIHRADVIVVANPDGYIGASTFGELCVALALGKAVYVTAEPSENSVGYSELEAWGLPIWGDSQ